MAWNCKECSSKFEDDVKPKPYGLCHTCYFNPRIVKQYRKGGLKYEQLTESAQPVLPSIAYKMVDDHQVDVNLGDDLATLKVSGKEVLSYMDEEARTLRQQMDKLQLGVGVQVGPAQAMKPMGNLHAEAELSEWQDFRATWATVMRYMHTRPMTERQKFFKLMTGAALAAADLIPTDPKPVKLTTVKPSAADTELNLMLNTWPGRLQVGGYINRHVRVVQVKDGKLHIEAARGPMSEAQTKSLMRAHEELKEEEQPKPEAKYLNWDLDKPGS